jgi:translation initiation factor IF-1
MSENKTYIGLAIADSMFAVDATINRTPMTVGEVKEIVMDGVVSGFNPSHQTTILALATKHDIVVPVPERAPMIKLAPGDRIVVMSARFPRRLSEGETWTQEEVDQTTFAFGCWTVMG